MHASCTLFHSHLLFVFCFPSLQKLFQAVEEARGMLAEAPGSALPLLAYPQPVKEDMRKSGRQLLQFLRQAALEPAVSVASRCPAVSCKLDVCCKMAV
jgi:hypothetical protein